MPLLLLDLDNTLIDRAGAFREWAARFAAHVRREGTGARREGTGARREGTAGPGNGTDPQAETEWLVAADRDGFEPRDRLATAIRNRYALTGIQDADMVTALRDGLVENIRLDPAVPDALDRARTAGWTPVVVTNGTVHQQARKLRLTGLADHVAGWVISEDAGLRKPDPRIFRVAAERHGASLTDAWMIGDSAEADIKGAHDAGVRSVWLHRGRPWDHGLHGEQFAPTLIAATCSEAIDAVLSAR